jgi:TRAP-type C4-dicarboxylate transport system permease small subunit
MQGQALLLRLERAAVMGSVILLLAIMTIVCVDVAMRYLFRAPLTWVHDFVSMYAMTGLFFLGLASSYRKRAHIGVDVLVLRLSPLWQQRAARLGHLVGLLIFMPIVFLGAERAWVSFVNREVVDGLIPWPTWLGNILVPIGAGVLCLTLASALLQGGHALSEGESDPSEPQVRDGGSR